MTRIQPLPLRLSLDPHDLRLAAIAYEAALQSVAEDTSQLSAYAARQELARFILERIRAGEADVSVLADKAVQHLNGRGLR